MKNAAAACEDHHVDARLTADRLQRLDDPERGARPSTRVSATRMRAGGKRVWMVVITSCRAAAWVPVTRPIRRGKRGSGRLRRRGRALRRRASVSAARSRPDAHRVRSARARVRAAGTRLSPRRARAPERVDRLALRQVELQRVEHPPRDRGGQARAVGRILEREEDAAPALRSAQLRHLALDPQRRQPLEPVGDAAVEARDGVDLPVAVEQWSTFIQAEPR